MIKKDKVCFVLFCAFSSFSTLFMTYTNCDSCQCQFALCEGSSESRIDSERVLVIFWLMQTTVVCLV